MSKMWILLSSGKAAALLSCLFITGGSREMKFHLVPLFLWLVCWSSAIPAGVLLLGEDSARRMYEEEQAELERERGHDVLNSAKYYTILFG
ncbi:hypothetical protein Tco_0570027 [Tanacetum coccineum]